MPDISALYVYENSVQKSALNDSSHFNLDEFVSPQTHKQKANKDFNKSNINHNRQQEDKMSILRSNSVSHFLDRVNDLSKTTENRKLETSVDQLNTKITEFVSLLTNQTQLLSQDAVFDSLVKQLNHHKSELRVLTDRIELHKREVDKVNQSLQVTKELLQEKSKELSDLSTKRNELTETIANSESEISAKQKLIGDLEITALKLQRTLDDNQLILSHKQAEIEELVIKRNKTEERINKIKEKCTEIDLETSEFQKQIYELEELRKMNEEERNMKEEELAKLQKQVRVQESQRRNLETQKNELGKLCEELNFKVQNDAFEVAKLSSEQLKLSAVKKTLESALSDSHAKLSQLQLNNERLVQKNTEMRQQIRHNIASIDSLSRDTNDLDLLALCGQFVAQVESSLSHLSKSVASNQLRIETEANLSSLKEQIIAETVRLKVQESTIEAQSSLTEMLSAHLSKLKSSTADVSTQSLVRFETLKADFVDSIYDRLNLLREVTEFDAKRGSKDLKMSEILIATDNQLPESRRESELDTSRKTHQIREFLRSNTDKPTSSQLSFEEIDILKIVQEEPRTPEPSVSSALPFSRKKTPDQIASVQRQNRMTKTPIKTETQNSKQEFSDIEIYWNAISRDLGSIVQFITKGSSLFVNTVSFFVGKLPKESVSVQTMRTAVMRFVNEIYE